MQIDRKWDHLKALLGEVKCAVLAYSGGVDSSLLLRASAEVLGPNLIVVTAVSPTYPTGELEEAKSFVQSLGVRHRIIDSGELEQEAFVRNDRDRCYYCKQELFGKLRAIADTEGITAILDGTNTDDSRDYRPGSRAAHEFGVRSPLAEAGMSKQDIRDLSQRLGLAVWDKPSLACLSSRIPYGTRITRELLDRVQAAEDAVRSMGIRQVRVRHHGDTARIEIRPADFSLLTAEGAAALVSRKLKELGYTYVCLDLEGYRTGSMNAALGADVAGINPRSHEGVAS